MTGGQLTVAHFRIQSSRASRYFASDSKNEKTHRAHLTRLIPAIINKLAVNLQKFRHGLCRIRALYPTAFTEEEILSIGFAIHLGKWDKMFCKALYSLQE